MKRTVSKLSSEARERLALVEFVQSGGTVKDAAERWGIDLSTAYMWIRWYEAEGISRLDVPRKPRPAHELDPDLIRSALAGAPTKYHPRLHRLLELAKGKQLTQVAQAWGVSAQAIMKDRRLFEQGKLPPIVQL
jgi:transposase-like protein